jgi:hypothetical protein
MRNRRSRLLTLLLAPVAILILSAVIGVVALASGTNQRATPTAVTSSPVINKIVVENQKPGTKWKASNLQNYGFGKLAKQQSLPKRSKDTPYSDLGSDSRLQSGWQDTKLIKGYVNRSSINHGESLNFYVSSKIARYDINVYRVGWYGGDGTTFYAGVENLVGTDHGVPDPDPVTGMVVADWPVAWTLNTTTSWPSGYYVVWLTEHGVTEGYTGYIPFVVRDDGSTADILYQVPFSTYQAYNAWGGKSLYEYNSPGGRAHKVSFDRPYDHDDGLGLFYSGDYNMIRW